MTLSFLEDAFLDLLTAHDLPAPRTNVDHDEDKVDCHWADLDRTIELLGYRYHASRHAFEDDVARRRRSNSLAYTYADVVERGAAGSGASADAHRERSSSRRGRRSAPGADVTRR